MAACALFKNVRVTPLSAKKIQFKRRMSFLFFSRYCHILSEEETSLFREEQRTFLLFRRALIASIVSRDILFSLLVIFFSISTNGCIYALFLYPFFWETYSICQTMSIRKKNISIFPSKNLCALSKI